MLILFDVDATLISTSRAGILAMEDIGREIYGSDFTVDRTEFSGRLDPLIIGDLLRDNDRPVTPDAAAAFRDGYRRHLVRRLAVPGVARALPGVMDLLGSLRARDGVTIGLLTGNYRDTGCIKLSACGVDPGWFDIHVWGDDSPFDPPARDHLPPLALCRYGARFGAELSADRATIIGDTPHDVRCGLVNGCRVLGVATGQYPVERLLEAGAHHAVPDLTDTAEVLRWLLGPS